MARPTVFADEPFTAALERSRSSQRWLIVDATAEWCGPCKNMDRTTWQDPEVVAWLQAHATALQIDVDGDQDWARAHAINAMPTLIAFKAGAEVDRIVGGRKPRELLDWLDGLERGETAADQLRRALGEAGTDADGRFELARALLAAGKLDEAATHFVWLWENMAQVNPAMSGVRVSFMASEIELLVARDPGARAQFGAIRDRTAIAAEAGTNDEARYDWVVLNEVLGDTDATLAWFEHVAATRSGVLGLTQLSNRLIPLLLSRDRWADAARLIDDGVAELVRYHEMIAMDDALPNLDEELRAQIQEMNRSGLRMMAAKIRHMLIAGGRGEEAAAVERKALDLDPSDDMKAWLARPRGELVEER